MDVVPPDAGSSSGSLGGAQSFAEAAHRNPLRLPETGELDSDNPVLVPWFWHVLVLSTGALEPNL